jgi:hypothetical protein
MSVFDKRRFVPLGLSLLLCVVMTGCSQNPQAAKATDPTNDKPGLLGRVFGSSVRVTVSEGTDLTVVLDQSLSTMENRAGDPFQASVVVPIESFIFTNAKAPDGSAYQVCAGITFRVARNC